MSKGSELYSEPALVDQLLISDRVALRLGRMAMRFAAVESMTRWMLLMSLGVAEDDEEKVEAIISELPFRKLRASLMVASRDSPLGGGERGVEILKKIVKRIERLEERRNVSTHSSWNYSTLPQDITRQKTGVGTGKLQQQSESFSAVDSLDQLVVDLDAVGAELSGWYAGTHADYRSDAGCRQRY